MIWNKKSVWKVATFGEHIFTLFPGHLDMRLVLVQAFRRRTWGSSCGKKPVERVGNIVIYHARRWVPWLSGWTCWITKFQGDVWPRLMVLVYVKMFLFPSFPSKYTARTDGLTMCFRAFQDLFHQQTWYFGELPHVKRLNAGGGNPSTSIAIMFM